MFTQSGTGIRVFATTFRYRGQILPEQTVVGVSATVEFDILLDLNYRLEIPLANSFFKCVNSGIVPVYISNMVLVFI